ncbi:MAG: hypothetical protein J3R72DRAFT_239507 [Linnemannia gamsii]|nr:MAG: hypothetical protein J3R72DRAFT_239507 [Linnemannia gamsii]
MHSTRKGITDSWLPTWGKTRHCLPLSFSFLFSFTFHRFLSFSLCHLALSLSIRFHLSFFFVGVFLGLCAHPFFSLRHTITPIRIVFFILVIRHFPSLFHYFASFLSHYCERKKRQMEEMTTTPTHCYIQ